MTLDDFPDLPAFPPGEVWLVGSGPGDPRLLTVLALHALSQADDIVHDALVDPRVLRLVRSGAELIAAGKRGGRPSPHQAAINDVLIDRARLGRRVVRLKGGDPFVFGRNGEELQALAAEGLSFEVVPGVTAACGVASHAGIPLTHRDHAQACVFVTGHLKDGSCDLDWPTLARPRQTVVIYMGLNGLAEICRCLMAHGLGADWPAAVVEQGTLPGQRVVCATLATLPERVAEAGLASPCLTIVGEVVRLQSQLAWFGR